MKKELAKITLLILLATLAAAPSTWAGTWMLGVKGWYTTWDSSLMSWAEKDIEALFANTGVEVDVKKKPGTGYLAGPVLGYQTGDGLWSFSLAAMVFSQFNQSVDMDIITEGMSNVESDGELERIDFDLVATYSLFKHGDRFALFRYATLFFGLKYQVASLSIDVNYIPSDITQEARAFTHDIEQKALMPTIGTGFSFPLGSKFAAGLQLGLLYVITDLTLESDNETSNIWTKPSLGFNGEATISYLPFSSLVLQLGYRYQDWTLTAALSDGEDGETKSGDVTHGPTLTLVYLW